LPSRNICRHHTRSGLFSPSSSFPFTFVVNLPVIILWCGGVCLGCLELL
jgi:hypothetical protein